jgi:hypothetical protein
VEDRKDTRTTARSHSSASRRMLSTHRLTASTVKLGAPNPALNGNRRVKVAKITWHLAGGGDCLPIRQAKTEARLNGNRQPEGAPRLETRRITGR